MKTTKTKIKIKLPLTRCLPAAAEHAGREEDPAGVGEQRGERGQRSEARAAHQGGGRGRAGGQAGEAELAAADPRLRPRAHPRPGRHRPARPRRGHHGARPARPRQGGGEMETVVMLFLELQANHRRSFYNHGEGRYQGLLLVESAYKGFHT